MRHRVFTVLSVCAALVWVLEGGAAAAPPEGRTGRAEVGLFGGGYFFDDNVEVKNSGVLGARGGYWLTDPLLVELSVDGVPTKEEHGSERANLFQGHADLLYHFDLGGKIEPFVAAGLGAGRYHADSQSDSNLHFLVDYGIGARYQINDCVAARVDLRQPTTFGDTSRNLMLTVGVSFLFGGKPTPVAVAAPAPPPAALTATLTANPDVVTKGEPTKLTWTTRNATEVSLEGVGPVATEGSRSVVPAQSTTYNLTARGPGGQATASASVKVNQPAPPPAPIATLAASPDSLRWGESTTLTWTTKNAIEATLDDFGEVATNGSRQVTPEASKTYRLLAKGPGGTAEAKATVNVTLPESVCITLHLEFDFDRADIKPQYHDEIGRVGKFMNTYPKTRAVIEGHTDSIGTPEYNKELSLRRARAVVSYLVDKFGISRERLEAEGYGFSKPIADNSTAVGRQKNRRIEAQIDCVVR